MHPGCVSGCIEHVTWHVSVTWVSWNANLKDEVRHCLLALDAHKHFICNHKDTGPRLLTYTLDVCHWKVARQVMSSSTFEECLFPTNPTCPKH